MGRSTGGTSAKLPTGIDSTDRSRSFVCGRRCLRNAGRIRARVSFGWPLVVSAASVFFLFIVPRSGAAGAFPTVESGGDTILVANPGSRHVVGRCCSICRINAHAHAGVGVAGNLIPPFVMLATCLVTPWLFSSTSMVPSDAAVSARFFLGCGPPPSDLRNRNVVSGAGPDALAQALDVDLGSVRANEHRPDFVPVRGCCLYDPGPRTSRIGTL